MTIKQAYKELKRQVNCWRKGKSFAYRLDPLIVAVAALEKQIPQKVVFKSNFTALRYCPSCGVRFIGWGMKYCGECGQRLDWSEILNDTD